MAKSFRDIVGKLDVLNVERDECGRRRHYHVHRLVERYEIDAKLFDWSDEMSAVASAESARFAFDDGNMSSRFLVGIASSRRRNLYDDKCYGSESYWTNATRYAAFGAICGPVEAVRVGGRNSLS